jgi:predicted nucleic acid-binding Zn ribbon protein
MERKSEQKIGSLLDQFIRANHLEKGLAEYRVRKAWTELLGVSVSRATQNLYIKDKILFVKLHSSVMRNELSMMKSDIIPRLNESAGSEIIEDIIIK